MDTERTDSEPMADDAQEVVASDVGIDAGAADAEEAAVHVVEDDAILPDGPPDDEES